ncbi:MAG: hypothetical protein LKI39_15605 [Bacteroides sp.]|jgi:hypothetical protein|nr:hypothetical protein [Bacteroides sp.]
MKTFKLSYIPILFVSLLAVSSCSKDDSSENAELRLSVSDEMAHTDGIEYSFDIISGGGGYKAEVCNDKYAKATLTGNHVKVDLVSESTQVKVTDKYNQEVYLLIHSDNKSIQTVNNTVRLSYGSSMKLPTNWGAGGYSVLRQSNNTVAKVTFDDKDSLLIQSLAPGEVWFRIIDKRGSTNGVSVTIDKGWDLNSNQLTVNAEGESYYTFPLKYGEGGWKITSCPAALVDPSTVVIPKDKYHEHDMLQIFVPKESNAPLVLQLEDKVKNTATITVNIAKK